MMSLDPRKGIDAVHAAKVGVVAGAAAATGGLAAEAALAGTAALGIGGAAGSAAVAGTVGGAVGGFTAGAGSAVAEGKSLQETWDQGAIGALAGSIGGGAGAMIGEGAGALASRFGAGEKAASAVGGFLGGVGGDVAAQGAAVSAGVQDRINLTQSLAVGAASAAASVVQESHPPPKTPPPAAPPAPASGASRLPRDGRWTGERGNSTFIPNRASKLPHPEDPLVVDLKPGEGIPFRNGRPDFSRHAVDEFQAPGLDGSARDRTRMALAVAERYGLKGAGGQPTAAAGLEYMERLGLVPHHAGGTTVQLVPQGIHGSAAGRIGIPHIGGASGLRTANGTSR